MTRSLYKQLGDAQETAARNGTPAPCTVGDLARWSSDILSAVEQRELITQCMTCPVLDPCLAYRDDNPMNVIGVVAGAYLRHQNPGSPTQGRLAPGRTTPRHTRGERRPTNRVGSTTIERVIELAAEGQTVAYIAGFAGVQDHSIWRILRRARTGHPQSGADLSTERSTGQDGNHRGQEVA